jgi:penicillin-binding protein 2
VSLGIGQGEIAWTPVHAANAYAMLARGGAVRDATLVADDALRTRSARRADVAVDPAAVGEALAGLRDAVSEPYGTGHHVAHEDGAWEPVFNAEGVTIFGKTGTAEAPPLRLADTNGDGRIDGADEGIRDLDHAWFVGLVGAEGERRPRYAIAVVVEYGGSGGRTAGPVANQIVRALQAEGYLPDPSRPDRVPGAGPARDEPGALP